MQLIRRPYPLQETGTISAWPGNPHGRAGQEYLNHVAMLMNTRPRQTLGWKTPAEVMDKEIAEFRLRAALAS